MKDIPLLWLMAFMRLIRWPNVIMVIVTQWLIYRMIAAFYLKMGLSPALGTLMFSLLVLATASVAAAGYIINDIFDVETDTINKPEKVLIGREFSRELAMRLFILLSGVSIVSGFIVAFYAHTWRMGLLYPLAVMMLWLYAERMKQTVLTGNLAVSLMSSFVILLVWIFEFFAVLHNNSQFEMITPFLKSISMVVLAYTLFAFLLSLAREIIKDAEDVEGDRLAGCVTLAVKHGIANSVKSAFIILIITFILVAYSAYLLAVGDRFWLLTYFIIFTAFPLMYATIKTILAKTNNDFHHLSLMIKLIMAGGIAGLVPVTVLL